jgi:hypothetical protein
MCKVTSNLCSAKLVHLEPNHVEPNQGLHHQISMYKQKTEENTTKVNWHNPLFWDFVHHLLFKAA